MQGLDHDDGQETTQKLTELAREVVESRNQMIKTSNAVSNLSSEIRDIRKQAQGQERSRTINSITAYVLFLVLTGGGFYFTFHARIERVQFEKDVIAKQLAAAKNDLQELHGAQKDRSKAQREALAFYRLIDEGKVHQAIKRYPDIAQLPLTKVEAEMFRDWVRRNRDRLSYQSYSAGMRAVGEKKWRRAVTEFRRSASLVKKPPNAAALHYYLGVAQAKLGNYPAAADAMHRSVTLGAEKLISREVHYFLAGIYEQLGRREKARRSYEAYIKRNPTTRYAKAARRRIKALDR